MSTLLADGDRPDRRVSELEHERQMAAIHEARAQMQSLSLEERHAHKRAATSHLRAAASLQRSIDTPPRRTRD